VLPTFVIGLREGLEAALIVGIIAAFLRKQGRRDLLRWVLIGVGSAIVLCLGIGIALNAYSRNLPQRQQEGLETVIGVLAVGMVTYMVVWMRRNSRHLKGQLEGLAADAIGGASKAGRAMVLMAFLAVIREGMETVVFLLAAFNEAGSNSGAGAGALLGILVAVGLGYGIYRGGVRLNLSKFFRATGLVLVLVAAGLVVNALHTAHEAGWLDAGQGGTVDLSWLVQPGTVQASLLTGMLGIQSHPVVVEIVGWLVYLVPVGLYVGWPPGRPVPTRAIVRSGIVVGVLAGVGAIVLTTVAPGRPLQRPVTTSSGGITAQVVARNSGDALVRTQDRQVVAARTGSANTFRVVSAGSGQHAGLPAEEYRETLRGTGSDGQPSALATSRVAELNGGRLPLGARPDATGRVPTTYRDITTLSVWLDARTDRVLDVMWTERITASVKTPSGAFELADPITDEHVGFPAGARAAAAASARDAHAQLDRRSALHSLAAWCTALAVVALLVATGFALAARGRKVPVTAVAVPSEPLVRS
jgi:high-affinity iron transporter